MYVIIGGRKTVGVYVTIEDGELSGVCHRGRRTVSVYVIIEDGELSVCTSQGMENCRCVCHRGRRTVGVYVIGDGELSVCMT